MKTMILKQKILTGTIVLLLLISLTAGLLYYQYHKKATPIDEVIGLNMTAANLFKDFSNDEQKANTKYLNKVLEINGKVLDVKNVQQTPMQIILNADESMFGIACTMETRNSNIKIGDSIKVKGLCTGYLNDVIMIHCLIIH